MPLTLDLTPAIFDRLTQAAIAHGLSIEDYTLRVLTENIPALAPLHPPQDRQTIIQQMHDLRLAIVTHGPDLSQTIVDARAGERY